MKAIQFILVPSLILMVLVYFLHLRSRLVDRMIVLLFGIASCSMVLFPNATQKLANLLGVGRGVDLVMYLGLLGLAFICLLLFSKLRQLDQLMTQIVRKKAIEDPHHPKDASATKEST